MEIEILTDRCIEVWTRATIEASDHDRSVQHNYQELQLHCERWLGDVQENLIELGESCQRLGEASMEDRSVGVPVFVRLVMRL